MILPRRETRPALLRCLLLIFAASSAGCAGNFFDEAAPATSSGWKIKFDGSGSNPVIADGVLYVGSADGAVHALDAKTGEAKWRFQTGDHLSQATSGPQVITVRPGTGMSDQMASGMHAAERFLAAGIRRVDMTPTVKDGTLFIGAGDNYFYAIDAATGKKKWSYGAGVGMASKLFASLTVPAPIVDDGTVYCVTETGLHAIDLSTGQRKWLFDGRHFKKRLVKSVVAGQPMLLLSGNGGVYALAPESGTERWATPLDGWDVTEPVAAKGLVFVAAYGSTSGSDRADTLHAIDPVDGKVRWKRAAAKVFGPSRLLVLANTIYFSTDRVVLAVELDTGREVWSFKADDISGGLTADDQHLYVVTHKGTYARPRNTLHALAVTTGQEKWSRGLSGGASVYMARAGLVYTDKDAVDATTGKTLWSFGADRASVRLISGGRIFLVSETVTYSGMSRVTQGYLYAIDAKAGKP